jgi:hypothetical protein
MSLTLFLLATGVLVVTVPLTLYLSGRSSGRNMWGLLLRGYEKHGAGAYRAHVAPVWVAGKPPLSVHIAAISSFILGQMVVPGGIAALLGLVVSLELLSRGVHGPGDYVIFVLQLSVPTGMLIAGRLLTVGLGLLQRAEGVVQKARSVARLSIIHNVVLLACMGGIYAMATNDAVYFPAGYACVSIAQAVVLLVAARAIDAHGAAEARDRELAPPPAQLASGRV